MHVYLTDNQSTICCTRCYPGAVKNNNSSGGHTCGLTHTLTHARNLLNSYVVDTGTVTASQPKAWVRFRGLALAHAPHTAGKLERYVAPSTGSPSRGALLAF